jgi:hypothetical protein
MHAPLDFLLAHSLAKRDEVLAKPLNFFWLHARALAIYGMHHAVIHGGNDPLAMRGDDAEVLAELAQRAPLHVLLRRITVTVVAGPMVVEAKHGRALRYARGLALDEHERRSGRNVDRISSVCVSNVHALVVLGCIVELRFLGRRARLRFRSSPDHPRQAGRRTRRLSFLCG